MHRITLSAEERRALDWIGDRYFHGDRLADLLVLNDPFVSPEDPDWDSNEPMTFTLDAETMQTLYQEASAEDTRWTCFAPELAAKLETLYQIAASLRPAVDQMLESYIATALWSSNDFTNGDENGEPMLDANYNADDLHPTTRQEMHNDCAAFLSDNYQDIAGEYSRAGHDFWLTRNRHGAGFWDGDWPQDAGRRLTDAARVYGSVDLYVGDDGQIYLQ